jgi:CRISPR-associated exonuclease Cas4
MQKDKAIFSAGDIEKFGYCPLSWWLSGEGKEEGDNLREGIKKHEIMTNSIADIKRREKKSKEAEAAILWFAIIATIISLLAITFLPFKNKMDISKIFGVVSLVWLLAACYFLYKAEVIATESKRLIYERVIVGFAMVAVIIAVNSITFQLVNQILSQVLGMISLIWLMGASFFLHRSLTHLYIAAANKKKHEIKGKIEYVDENSKRPKLLRSKKHNLSGRPDYVLVVNGNYIPVEIKTGRTPRGPLFSHVLQLAAYCLLIEDEYAHPPYGILKYENAEHRIDFDDRLRDLLLKKLGEMKRAVKTGEVHRNHNRLGKCKNCSRRQFCPESLH